ncbi:MAG: DUF5398 family protein [Chlamydiae bacterium]|nr:DUF5398 family protein [Chlamydiota bacterium]
MFGLEKKENGLFEFDLEKDLKTEPLKKQKLVKHIEEKIQEIKTLIRQGSSAKEFDQFGVLLHAYAALLKVINKIAIKK